MIYGELENIDDYNQWEHDGSIEEEIPFSNVRISDEIDIYTIPFGE